MMKQIRMLAVEADHLKKNKLVGYRQHTQNKHSLTKTNILVWFILLYTNTVCNQFIFMSKIK